MQFTIKVKRGIGYYCKLRLVDSVVADVKFSTDVGCPLHRGFPVALAPSTSVGVCFPLTPTRRRARESSEFRQHTGGSAVLLTLQRNTWESRRIETF